LPKQQSLQNLNKKIPKAFLSALGEKKAEKTNFSAFFKKIT
jgi:hypothetical protein